ncbi:MAG: tol-pal system protein YbgF [Methylococcaceae bacterium]|nr:tol-pal system protein YbgF [Methylococcaceae bacterium]
MKKSIILMFCAYSSVYAEPRVLPPVVDNSTYPGGSAYSSSAPSNNAMYEVLGRLEQMQIEIQQLRGVVEEQSQTIIDLKKRQSNIYSDLDLRLQELTGGHVKTVASVDSETSVGNSKSAVENSVDNAIVAKGVKETAAPVKQDSKANDIVDEVPVLNQKEMYQSAYETLRNGHNTRAISAFKTLLAEFPAGEYADNSQYWLAEAYKVNQDLNSAKAAFTKVVSQYSNSPKVPDALLKLGYIELEQNNKAKARDYLTQVTVNYPGTTAAHLAAKKLRQMEDIQP